MADRRMLHRRITQSKQVADLPCDGARLLFTWLIPFTDDMGRFVGEADLVKAAIFPRDHDKTIEQVEHWLNEMHIQGLIFRYTANDGRRYIRFPSFEKYQTLKKDRKPKIEYPEPPTVICDYSPGFQMDPNGIQTDPTGSNSIQIGSLREDKGSEGKVSEEVEDMKYTEAEKVPVDYLKDELQRRGMTYFPKDWHLKGYAVSKKLQAKISAEDLMACIVWALNDDFWGKQVDSMMAVERCLPKWQLFRKRNYTPSKPTFEAQIDPRALAKYMEAGGTGADS